jgi:hypothetical protein
MNIKNLRRNYDGLTMLERLALADNAEARDDESEIRAINAASPKEHFRQVDFYDLMRQITTFRLCNLIVRLSYIINFDFFITLAELDILKSKPNYEAHEKHVEDAKMSAFLYVRATDSWQIVNNELGLRPNWDEEISEFLFSHKIMKEKEDVMRRMALNEDEATELIKKHYGNGRVKSLEDEANSIREALGLPKK